jgi:hypothetical protein
MNDEKKALSWDDEFISMEGCDDHAYELPPEGDYDFTVVRIERARHEQKPGGVIPDCPKAIVFLRLEGYRTYTVKHALLLHERVKWRLANFFAAVGMVRDGGIVAKWDELPGATGRCRISHRSVSGRVFAECAEFYPAKQQRQSQQPQQTQDEEDIPF